jgi:hypothetical protein
VANLYDRQTDLISLQRRGYFCFRCGVQANSGDHPISYTVGVGTLSLGIKRKEREPEESTPSSSKVKNTRSCISTHPDVFTACFLIKHRTTSLPSHATCSEDELSPRFRLLVYVAMDFSSSLTVRFILLIIVLTVRISRALNESNCGTQKITPFSHVGVEIYLLHTSRAFLHSREELRLTCSSKLHTVCQIFKTLIYKIWATLLSRELIIILKSTTFTTTVLRTSDST